MAERDNMGRRMANEILTDEMRDAFIRIAEAQKETLRQCRTMLAGFKATKEKDLDYMDRYMDRLFDFMDQGSDEEFLYRKYLVHIESFNPEESRHRFENLENDLGYWSPVVYAAYLTAKKIHEGQLDKGGNDYFTSHSLKVGSAGFDWKEKMVGLLHDAAEDTEYDEDAVILMIKKHLQNFSEKLSTLSWEEIVPFEDAQDLCPYPPKSILFPTESQWKEIDDALKLMNHHTAGSREEYIRRFGTNMLALKVKLNDLKNNMDLSRIPAPKPEDYARVERYKSERSALLEMLDRLLRRSPRTP